MLSVFERVKPDLVIHTAGLVNVDYCEEHEDEAWVINVDGTENVALVTKRWSTSQSDWSSLKNYRLLKRIDCYDSVRVGRG